MALQRLAFALKCSPLLCSQITFVSFFFFLIYLQTAWKTTPQHNLIGD